MKWLCIETGFVKVLPTAGQVNTPVASEMVGPQAARSFLSSQQIFTHVAKSRPCLILIRGREGISHSSIEPVSVFFRYMRRHCVY